MKVRRRPMPLTKSLKEVVEKGLQPDPRKGRRAEPKGHVPKMRGTAAKREDRPVLYNTWGSVIG